MRKKLGLTEPTFMRLNPEVKRGIEVLARNNNLSVSQYVNDLLGKHVKAKSKEIEAIQKETEELIKRILKKD